MRRSRPLSISERPRRPPAPCNRETDPFPISADANSIPYPFRIFAIYHFTRLQRHDSIAAEHRSDGLLTRLKGVAPALEPQRLRHGKVDTRESNTGLGHIPSSTPRDIVTSDLCWGKEHVRSGPRGARSSHGLCCMQCCVCGSHSRGG